MTEIADLTGDHRGVAVAGVIQELLYLVAADITQDAAKITTLIEPVWSTRAFPMWTRTQCLDDLANCALFNQLPGEYRTFHMQTLTVINGIFTAGFDTHRSGIVELFQSGKGSLIGKIVFICRHDLQPQGAAL